MVIKSLLYSVLLDIVVHLLHVLHMTRVMRVEKVNYVHLVKMDISSRLQVMSVCYLQAV